MSDYHRPLYNFEVAQDFVKKVLGVPEEDPEYENHAFKIYKEERVPLFAKDTLKNPAIRNAAYKDEDARNQLREQIVHEMITQERLDDDEQVRLGTGGARPKSVVGSKRKLFYVIGLPASGKSSICGKICDLYGAYLLDSDLVKRKLPEFFEKSGASLVHKESSIITMGGYFKDKLFNSILEYCYVNGLNICLPKIGNKQDDIEEWCSILKNFGYSIYMILVSLDRTIATKRAFDRYLRTNRYVPLSMIFDGYANDPILCYYRLRKKLESGDRTIDGMIALSTNVPHNTPLEVLDDKFSDIILDRLLKIIRL